MRKITIPYLVFASLYFVLALFTILALTLASTFDPFWQMFYLTTQPFGVYFNMGIVLLSCGVIVCIFNIARIYVSHLPKIYSLSIGVTLCIFLCLLYSEVFILERSALDFFSLKDSLVVNRENVFDKNLYEIVMDYVFYCAFVGLPSLVYIANLSFDKIAFGKILQLTQPNFSVIVCTLFGFTVNPFFNSGIYGYVDLVLLGLGMSFVVLHCYKRYVAMDSYAFFNVFLLFCVCAVVFLGDFKFVQGEAYFEVRKVFYSLALLSWSNFWMLKLTTFHNT